MPGTTRSPILRAVGLRGAAYGLLAILAIDKILNVVYTIHMELIALLQALIALLQQDVLRIQAQLDAMQASSTVVQAPAEVIVQIQATSSPRLQRAINPEHRVRRLTEEQAATLPEDIKRQNSVAQWQWYQAQHDGFEPGVIEIR